MFKSIKIVNYKNEELLIDFFNSATTGFNIRKIDGLGPVKADITTTRLVTTDGETYNSARANGRNIVLTLGFVMTPEIGLKTIEDCRQKTYIYFPLKKKLKFIVTTDNREIYTYGYVESNSPDIWSKDETTQISIVCPNSWFISAGSNEIPINNVKPIFKFPFEVLEYDIPPYEIYNIEGGMPIVQEYQDDNIFYGNEVFDLYKNRVMYSELDLVKYNSLSVNTYKELKVFSKEQVIYE